MLAHLIRYRHIMGNIRLLIFIYTHGTSHRGRQKGLNLPEKLKRVPKFYIYFLVLKVSFQEKSSGNLPSSPIAKPVCIYGLATF